MDRNSSNEEKIFIAKASLFNIISSYLFSLLFLSLVYFAYISGSDKNFSELLKDIVLNLNAWVLIVFSVVLSLNVTFRSVEFLENVIVVKRWYWKTVYYLYSEISEIKVYNGDEKNITISLKNGKDFEVPAYILNMSVDYPFFGNDLIEFLKQKTGRNVSIY
jgi:magnesium-transporting ATPase (P-type)